MGTIEINGRRLTSGPCQDCGTPLHVWVRPGEPLKCADCRDSQSRQEHGWRPANSRD